MSATNMGSQSLTAHQSTAALCAYLASRGVEHEVVEHDEAFTALAEARVASVPPEQACKSVVLEDRGAYMLALIPASERLDLAKVRTFLGADRSLRLAAEDEIAEHFSQFEVGSIPPIGNIVFAAEIMDRRLADRDRVMCACGDHRHSLLLDPAAIVRLADAHIADICED